MPIRRRRDEPTGPVAPPAYPFKWLPDGTPVDQLDEHLPTRAPARSGATPRRGPARKRRWVTVLEWVGVVIAAIAMAFVIKTFLFQAFYIPSESMMPTLQKNDRVVVNKLSYRLHDPRRGDIVVFTAPPSLESEPEHFKDLVKRVIGLPGDRVEGKDGYVYINGKRLPEPWLPKTVRTEPFHQYTVPPGHYWVMGDNRGNSRDSRFFPEHYIAKNQIVGRVFVRFWPVTRLSIL